MPASREDWKRVGLMLAERRVQLSARYANRRLFADETGLNWRTLYDAEYGKRASFRRDTVSSFETAYRLVPGSLARSLAGGPLEPLDVPPLSAAPSPAPLHAPGDVAGEVITLLLEDYPERGWHEVLAAIWRLRQDDKLSLLRQALLSRRGPREDGGAQDGECRAAPGVLAAPSRHAS